MEDWQLGPCIFRLHMFGPLVDSILHTGSLIPKHKHKPKAQNNKHQPTITLNNNPVQALLPNPTHPT
jgi:hypothetical protein